MMRVLWGHIVRWVLILIMSLFLSLQFPISFTPEGAIHLSLKSMEMPPTIEVHSMRYADGRYATIFVDTKHQLFHQAYLKKRFGLMWHSDGGGFGFPLDDNILVEYLMGMSTRDNKSYHYVTGQVNDPEIQELHLHWEDGLIETASPQDGFYLFFRSIKGNQHLDNSKLFAHDINGEILYELDWENRRIYRESTF